MTLNAAISPAQSDLQAALRAFLLDVLPGVPGAAAAVFVGTISGTTLTVAALPGLQPAGISGTIQINAPVLGAAPGTSILQQLTGSTGGVGTYQVSVSQTVSKSKTMATGVDVVAGQPNRTVEPANPYFVVVTPIQFPRLSTNVDGSLDVKFTGSLAAGVMTVTAVSQGPITPGSKILGTGVSQPTTILSQASGTPGGVGTYNVTGSQTVASETLSAGGKTVAQDSRCDVQIDFHAPDTTAGDMAQTVSTLFRDEYAINFFAALTAPQNLFAPLYADDPAQRPFVNAENQWEWRWVIDAKLEVVQTVVVPAEYADAVSVTTVSVNATYPP